MVNPSAIPRCGADLDLAYPGGWPTQIRPATVGGAVPGGAAGGLGRSGVIFSLGGDVCVGELMEARADCEALGSCASRSLPRRKMRLGLGEEDQLECESGRISLGKSWKEALVCQVFRHGITLS